MTVARLGRESQVGARRLSKRVSAVRGGFREGRTRTLLTCRSFRDEGVGRAEDPLAERGIPLPTPAPRAPASGRDDEPGVVRSKVGRPRKKGDDVVRGERFRQRGGTKSWGPREWGAYVRGYQSGQGIGRQDGLKAQPPRTTAASPRGDEAHRPRPHDHLAARTRRRVPEAKEAVRLARSCSRVVRLRRCPLDRRADSGARSVAHVRREQRDPRG